MKLSTLVAIYAVALLQAACATVKLPDDIKDKTPEERIQIRARVTAGAENGNAKSMEITANYFFYGWLGDVDLVKGNYWMHRSADLHWLPANARLADNYSRGIFGVAKDVEKSRVYVAETYEQYLRLTAGQRKDYAVLVAGVINTRGIDNITAGKKDDAIADFCLAISINPKSNAVGNLSRAGGKCDI